MDASILVALFMSDALTERADNFLRKNPSVLIVSDFAAAEAATLDHLVLSPSTSTPTAGTPFTVDITAKDTNGNTMTTSLPRAVCAATCGGAAQAKRASALTIKLSVRLNICA